MTLMQVRLNARDVFGYWISDDILIPAYEYAQNKLAFINEREPDVERGGEYLIELTIDTIREQNFEFETLNRCQQIRKVKVKGGAPRAYRNLEFVSAKL